MTFGLAIDHAGAALHDAVRDALGEAGCAVEDLGRFDDYPDAALAVGRAVLGGGAQRGLLVCGSGAGVAVAACKLPGIRAACAHDHYTAAQCVEHDDCNVLCLGARVIGPAIARDLTLAFAGARFSGEERHVRRLGKVHTIEQQGLESAP
jgi:ribose 5-phosphate isomerase B